MGAGSGCGELPRARLIIAPAVFELSPERAATTLRGTDQSQGFFWCGKVIRHVSPCGSIR